MKKAVSLFLAVSMLFSTFTFMNLTTTVAAGVTVSGGWYESAYAQWAPVSGASSYEVYYKKTSDGDGSYVKADEELIRFYSDKNEYRVDIPGLLGNTPYTLKVKASNGTEFTTNVTTSAYDRSGYAHFKYTEGVGAYKDDGTIKDNAIVVYVTDENKNTVQVPGYESMGTGIGKILNNNPAIIKAITSEHPLVIRIIGKVNPPEGLTGFNSTVNGGTEGDNGNMALIKDGKNITIEGIGYDAQVYGWGISFWARVQYTNGGYNFEVRNVKFDDTPEDCLGIEGEMEGDKYLTKSVERIWIHNNSFYSGYCPQSDQTDKQKGDGACDFKRGQYYTLSYNYFEEMAKCCLLGGNDKNLQYNSTFHHNWWNMCAQRCPLVRQANAHSYNNYYSNSTARCIDVRGNAYVLSEANYYDTCKRPYSTKSGGVVQSVGDVLVNTEEESSAAVTKASRTEVISNSNSLYKDFVINPDTFYYDPVNKCSDVLHLTDAETAKKECMLYSGVMKESYDGADVPVQPTTQTTTKETTTQTTTKETTQITTQNTEIVKGDVDLSGSLTASDGAKVLAYVLNTDANPLTNAQLQAADVDANNQITASDGASILAKVLNNDFSFK